MDLIKTHIHKYILDFSISKSDEIFNEVYESISSFNKTEFKPLLEQLFCVIKVHVINTNADLSSIHIHFQSECDKPTKTLIAEFVWNSFYHIHKKGDLLEVENKNLVSRINDIEVLLKQDIIAPSSNDRREFKKKIKYRKNLRKQLAFYKSLPINLSLKPRTLINLKINQEKDLNECFNPYPHYIKIQSLGSLNSYILTNVESFNSIYRIKFNEIPVFKELRNIILFDCEDRVQRFNQFNFQNLINLNQRHGTQFKNFILITFDNEDNSISSVRNKIELIKDRFKIPTNSSYTITKSEIDFLLNRKESAPLSIEFAGYESSSFWDTFVLETSLRELYELRSIKLMNIYSICYTDKIKDYIIGDLFSKKESSELISSSTKMAILELRDEDIEVLKEALSNTLDVIMNSGIKSKVLETLSNTPAIVLDEAILRNQNLLSKIKVCLGLTKSTKFKTWSDMLKVDLKYFLILSYRDQGRYPNFYFPNLLEFELDSGKSVNAILPNFLFGYHYKWSKYNLLKDYHKLLSHPIRENYFDWNTLKGKIKNLKPAEELKIDWDLENEYSNSEQRETFIIKLKNQREKTFQSSDFIIYSESNSDRLRIERIKWFYENIDFDETKFKIQKLDELLENLNFEKLIDISKQENQLKIIRTQLGLENEDAGRIWKVLLKKKGEEIGVDNLYKELKQLFSNNKISLVRQSYFNSDWLDTSINTLMPRGNKVVKVLFNYLNLSADYKGILYKIKIATNKGKKENTKNLNKLLKDLSTDGCLDSNENYLETFNNRIDYYTTNHQLEELGISLLNPKDDLITFIELVRLELNLLELVSIEKTKQ